MFKHIRHGALALVMVALSAISTGSQAAIIGTTGNSTVSGSVEGYDGWLMEDTFFGGIDFLVFEADPDSLFSIDVVSDVDFGISIYEGEIMNDAGIPFFNDADFFDFSGFLTFVAGTPSFGAIGSSISDLLLSTGGIYTVAIGGDDIFGSFGSIAYTASLVTSGAQAVPVPAVPALLLAGVIALGFSTRNRKQH